MNTSEMQNQETLELTVVVDEAFLKGIGDSCLVGTLVNQAKEASGSYDISNLNKVILEFPQSSLEWRRNNKGPDTYTLYEYNVMCLTQDLLYLKGLGIEVEVRKVHAPNK